MPPSRDSFRRNRVAPIDASILAFQPIRRLVRCSPLADGRRSTSAMKISELRGSRERFALRRHRL
jgi:hypothetical protein